MLFLVHIFPYHTLSLIFITWLLLTMPIIIGANSTTSTAGLPTRWWIEVKYVFVDCQINIDIIECVTVGHRAEQKKKQFLFNHYLM